MTLGDMNSGDCEPLQCEIAMGCIAEVRNPMASPVDMSSLRGQLLGCRPCLQAFDIEVRLRITMSPSMSDLPTADFRMRITQTLSSVDLSQLDITDF